MENVPEVHRHIPCHCHKHGKHVCWTSWYLKCILQIVFSLKYLFEDMEVSQDSPGRTWATLTSLWHCGWEAGGHSWAVSPCISPWLKPAACSESMGVWIFLVTPWATYQSLYKAESQNNYTALQRDRERELWEESRVGASSSCPEVVFCGKGLGWARSWVLRHLSSVSWELCWLASSHTWGFVSLSSCDSPAWLLPTWQSLGTGTAQGLLLSFSKCWSREACAAPKAQQ